jgi:hypothetical protein
VYVSQVDDMIRRHLEVELSKEISKENGIEVKAKKSKKHRSKSSPGTEKRNFRIEKRSFRTEKRSSRAEKRSSRTEKRSPRIEEKSPRIEEKSVANKERIRECFSKDDDLYSISYDTTETNSDSDALDTFTPEDYEVCATGRSHIECRDFLRKSTSQIEEKSPRIEKRKSTHFSEEKEVPAIIPEGRKRKRVCHFYVNRIVWFEDFAATRQF